MGIPTYTIELNHHQIHSRVRTINLSIHLPPPSTYPYLKKIIMNKQQQLVCFPVQEVELVYKQKFKPSERPKITNSTETYRVLLSTWNLGIIGFIEEFKILLLNRANRVIGCYEVSSGGLCGTIVDPRLVFAAALKSCATGLILAHNHPSGNLIPSEADLQLTSKLKEGGRLLDIMVIDHIILSGEGYMSFADEGYI